MKRFSGLASGVIVLLLVLASPAAAQDGVQTLKFKFGPLKITPGQNTIKIARSDLKPPVDGWIVGFRPNLERRDGSIPPVDAIHLHHAVWLINGAPVFAAGEEKTELRAPAGYGWRHRTTDRWMLNHMIHNLTPTAEQVYITYEIDFIPDTAPAATGMQEVRTVWLDAVGGAYPVFDAKRGSGGRDGRFTFPDEAPGAPRNGWTAPVDGVLVGAAGHLHPGGLWTELKLTRDGRTTPLFHSVAKYFEPAGAVSWDVALTVTPPQWRVQIRRGDVLSISGTYDSRRASWYESMAIMSALFNAGGTGGADPFATRVDVPGAVTHGHLRENDNHGGEFGGLPDARSLLSGAGGGRVAIAGFTYGRGDLNMTGRRGRPPVVRRGRGLTFVNRDARSDVMHTITACRAPCTRTTGVAYPLADGKVNFDSGNLGYGPRGFTAAANRVTWTTPKGLSPGTYTYFCRVHPFMRGSFRVRG